MEQQGPTDGLLIIRHLFGFEGESLIAGAITEDSALQSASEISAKINGMGLALDVDGNGNLSALTDGLLIIRRLFGFEGESLTAGALASDATRTDAAAIADYIDGLTP